MNRIFMLCLAGALCLAAVACDDDDKDGGSASGKMTVAGRTESVKSAFYMRKSGVDMLGLFKDVMTPPFDMEPEFGIEIDASETLLGRTLDLTKPLDNDSYLAILGVSNYNEITMNYYDGQVQVEVYTDAPVSVTAGTMYLSRSGDIFTVELSVTLSDGNSLSAKWKGKATQLQMPD